MVKNVKCRLNPSKSGLGDYFSHRNNKEKKNDVLGIKCNCKIFREFSQVRESMHSAMSTNKTEIVDVALDDFSEVNFQHSMKYYVVATDIMFVVKSAIIER